MEYDVAKTEVSLSQIVRNGKSMTFLWALFHERLIKYANGGSERLCEFSYERLEVPDE